jgi:hypothetical protein
MGAVAGFAGVLIVTAFLGNGQRLYGRCRGDRI